MSMTYPIFNTLTDGNKFYIREGNDIKSISIVGLCIENHNGKDTMFLMTAGSVTGDTTCKYTTDEILDLYKRGIIYFDKKTLQEIIEKEI